MKTGTLYEVIHEGDLIKRIKKWNNDHRDDPKAYITSGALGSGAAGLLFGGPAGLVSGAITGGLGGYVGYRYNKYKKKLRSDLRNGKLKKHKGRTIFS